MSEKNASSVKRKLVAILSADVQGYSRLMGDDEVATIRTLTAYRELMSRIIQGHDGRVVDSPGDNLLAEFSSAADAVQGAVEIQTELALRNAELSEDRQMHYRIGINVGDVVVEEEHIYGDGVNIAVRLESLPDGGGICISGSVHEQVENKLDLAFTYQGEQSVKNIAKPVPVYQVLWEAKDIAPIKIDSDLLRIGPEGPSPPGRGSLIIISLVIVSILGLGAFALKDWYPLLSSSVFWNPPILPLPDKPSIAVLPFINMSGDPEQEYFSDGITEDIITDLSKLSGLFVIARNSSFVYKDRTVDVEQVGQSLGVRYVLEGSVRRAEGKVRINAQLSDATTSQQVWADRYDGDLENIFGLQDEVTQQIVQALQVTLTQGEQTSLTHHYTNNLEAYDLYLRGESYLWRLTQEANTQARQMFEQAIALDPQYAAAHARLGWTYMMDWVLQWSQDPHAIQKAREIALQAIILDPSLPVTHQILGYIAVFQKQYEQGITALEQSITLDPNYAEGLAFLGDALTFAGRPQEALRLIQQAMRLNPHFPPRYLFLLGHTYRVLGQPGQAIALLRRSLASSPDLAPSYVQLVAAYIDADLKEEARRHATELLRLSPGYSVAKATQTIPYKDPAEMEHFLAALRQAGLE